MGDYQRQRDVASSPRGKGSRWTVRLFRRERSSSPAPPAAAAGGLRRSLSAGRPRSNCHGNDVPPPSSISMSRRAPSVPNRAAYRPPPTPPPPLLSNSSKNAQTVELTAVRRRDSRSPIVGVDSDPRSLNKTASLFDSISASLSDHEAENRSIHNNNSSSGSRNNNGSNVGQTASLRTTPSDEARRDGPGGISAPLSLSQVDAAVYDVICSPANEDGDAAPASTLADVENAGSRGMSSDLGEGGEILASRLRGYSLSAESGSVSLTADFDGATADGSVATNSILDPGWGGGGGGGRVRPGRHHSARSSGVSGHGRKRSGRRRKGSKREGEPAEEKLDTWSGVFLPCLAQIVGVIFFLRLPTITGQAGTVGATLIVFTCVFSTFVTSLSLSAIASNGTIQAGGPYYIISRTLGVEIGGALGILFYLGTTLGASMHVMGAVETMTHRKKHAYQNDNLGLFLTLLDSCPPQVWSLLLMFVIARIVSVGSRYVTGAANFFLTTVGLSIVSILLGTILFAFGFYDGSLSNEEREFNDNLMPNYRPDPKTGVTPTFWGLVAIFYPATTGIMAGTNRSSKLATPNQSIPIGTIGAIAVTTALYLFQVWLLGSVVSNEILIYNKLVLTAVAFPSRIVAKLGMVTSCVGAALQCMAGAPQLLGAIAADDAIPFLKFLTRKKRRRGDGGGAKGTDGNVPAPPYMFQSGGSLLGLAPLGESTSLDQGDGDRSEASEKSADIEFENSKRAVWFTWAIASLGTLLGNIDHITPILTMFYLMMYGGINLCCFLLAWVDSPGFRPQ